jgi:predicted Zn-dependent peptidase
VAAHRLSVPVEEGPSEAGAGQVLRDLALDRMRGLAGPVGARVSATRTPWGLAYSVEGAAADFEYLAYLLREAVAEPEDDALTLERYRQRLWEDVARRTETPSGRLISDLRRAVAPHLPPLRGSPATVGGLDAARIRSVWWRSHRPEAMTLVVAAAVVPEVVLASVKGMGATGSQGGPPLDAPALTTARSPSPQSLRTWYGEAFAGGAPSDPHGPVAALLISGFLPEEAQGFEAGIQLLALRDGWLIVVAGAAYRGEVRAMKATVSGALSQTRAGLTPQTVNQAVERLRRDILFEARTPEGLVEQIGRAMDIAGQPSAASDYLTELGRVDVVSLGVYLDRMISAGPATAEITP